MTILVRFQLVASIGFGITSGCSGTSTGTSVIAAESGTSGAISSPSSGTISSGAPNGRGSGASSGSGESTSVSGEAATGASGGTSGALPSGSPAGASGSLDSGSTGASGMPSTSGVMASGSAGESGANSDGSVVSLLPEGPSAGCGQAPIGAGVLPKLIDHLLTIPTCGDAGVAYPDCIPAAFAPGGSSYLTKNGEDYNHRDYAIGLPANYNPTTTYPIFFGGGGCGGPPPQTGNGFGINESGAIEIGMQPINGCFADGGGYCSGSGPIANCTQGPELPYFRAILAQVEAAFCIDRGKVFVGGFSSGAWEAFTLGCGAADLIRGIVTDEGGWRNHQPACTGPVAALMVAGEADGTNPIGPLVENTAYPAGGLSAGAVNTTIQSLDSNGSAPGRDAILQRNGCNGTATAVYDPNYPACVEYTGCPGSFPVVWCPLPGAGHNESSYNGVGYSPGNVQSDPLMWNFLSKLTAAN